MGAQPRRAASPSAGPTTSVVAVNVSAVQFRNRNLPQHVKAALERSGLPPARLELEVTESVLLADGVPTITILRQLRELGVRISVDNFGTGYSALSHLRSFPFDKVKIDKSFVHDLASAEDSRAIVDAVIGLGRSLGMSTTAEGVETDAQLDLVRAKGCTEVQGFLFSPPLPAAAIDRLFSGRPGWRSGPGRSARRPDPGPPPARIAPRHRRSPHQGRRTPRGRGGRKSMAWSITIARIAGSEIRIHLTFLILLAFYAWVGY